MLVVKWKLINSCKRSLVNYSILCYPLWVILLRGEVCLWSLHVWLYCSIAWKYSEDFPASRSTRRRGHYRSATEPTSLSLSYRPSSPSRSLSYALDDLDVSSNTWKQFSDPLLRFKTRYSPNLKASLGASDRIQQRVERVLEKKSDANRSFRKGVSLDPFSSTSILSRNKPIRTCFPNSDLQPVGCWNSCPWASVCVFNLVVPL